MTCNRNVEISGIWKVTLNWNPIFLLMTHWCEHTFRYNLTSFNFFLKSSHSVAPSKPDVYSQSLDGKKRLMKGKYANTSKVRQNSEDPASIKSKLPLATRTKLNSENELEIAK
jgi:hypothetical protein